MSQLSKALYMAMGRANENFHCSTLWRNQEVQLAVKDSSLKDNCHNNVIIKLIGLRAELPFIMA